MPRYRYVREDEFDRAVGEFIGWSIALTGLGLAALIKALRPKPSEYTPRSPDDPTQESTLDKLTRHFGTVDFSQAKLPQIEMSEEEGPTFIWNEEDRPKRLTVQEAGLVPVVEQPSLNVVTYRIAVPQIDADYQAGIELVRTLLTSYPRLTFTITAEKGATFWQIIDPVGRCREQIIFDHVKTYAPRAQIAVIEGEPLHDRQYPFYRQLHMFGMANEFAAPLPFVEMLKDRDPLKSISQRMDFLNEGLEERIVYALNVRVPTAEATFRATKRLMGGMIKPRIGIYRKREDDPLSGLNEEWLNRKLDGPLFHCFLSITVESLSNSRLNELGQIAADLSAFTLTGHNGIGSVEGQVRLHHEITSPAEAAVPWLDSLLAAMVEQNLTQWRDLLLVMCPGEIASFWHLPDTTFEGKNISWATPPIPPEVTGEAGDRVCLGDAEMGGKSVPVYLAQADRATHHIITGMIGTGKSTLLHQLIHDDIAAGRGVALIDPHGKLADDILRTSIPRHRINDLIVLECGNTDIPVPINPFRIPPATTFEGTFNTIYWVLRKVYESIWREGRMDVVLRNVLQALLCDPEATPLDISRIFSDAHYREHLLELMQTDSNSSLATEIFWREFANKSPGEKEQLGGPIMNRTSAFLGNRHLEIMTCHPQTIDFQQFMKERKIVLVNLSGEAIRSEVESLGAIFLAGFTLASEAMGYQEDGQPPRYYLYVDEVNRLITSPLPDMFAHERKFGLSMTLATQFIDQLDRDVRQGIFGTVGTKFMFECGDDDAKHLHEYVQPDLDGRELMNLGKFRMAVKTRANEKTLPTFIVNTRKPVDTESALPPDELREIGRSAIGSMETTAVREWLMNRYAPPRKSEPVEPGTGPDGLKDIE
ncbi:type IV secretory system conjugative DNA transfer family protein [Chloroflexota bacterium]